MRGSKLWQYIKWQVKCIVLWITILQCALFYAHTVDIYSAKYILDTVNSKK